MKTCKILESKGFYFSCFSMCHLKRGAHIFHYYKYNIYYRYNVSILILTILESSALFLM